jgi:hypothetical protein
LNLDLAAPSDISVEAYDVTGRVVLDLGLQHFLSGEHVLDIGDHLRAVRASSGVYFIRIKNSNKVLFSGKAIHIK